MARPNGGWGADVFGFDELEKDFQRLEKKYPDAADAFLMTMGQAVNKRVKQLTPVKTKKLRNSWRLKKVKLYQGGTVRVVRIQSLVPYSHLIELGHEIVRGGSSYRYKRTGEIITKGRNKGKRRVEKSKMNSVERSARGIKSGGYVEGTYMLEQAISESQKRFDSGAQKMLDTLTKDLEV